MSKPSKILVAGIGNIFLGDDAFGSEVARRLMHQTWPKEIRVTDFGIRSYDLAYAMMDGYDVTIFIDSTSRNQPPGTVYLIEPDLTAVDRLEEKGTDAHSMNPVRVLQLLKTYGGSPGKLYLVGCEPGTFEDEDGQFGLSEPVEAAVPQAIELIKSLINDLLQEESKVEMKTA